MAKHKRSLDDEGAVDLSNVDESRKKRIKYSKDDAQLANIYSELADEVPSVRIEAAQKLLKSVTSDQSNYSERLSNAQTRLIRGLCSSRKAARLGFSIALTEIFRLAIQQSINVGGSNVSLREIIGTITSLTTPEGNVSGQERRDHYLGRRFALHALLKTDVGLDGQLPTSEWQHLVQSIVQLATEKQWLRRECCTMLYEYLASPQASKLDDDRVRVVIDGLVERKLAKTLEGVGLWLLVQEQFAEVKLRKGVWHHKDPLAVKDLPILAKVLLEASEDDAGPNNKAGSRQTLPSFTWSMILRRLYQYPANGETERFSKVWDAIVVSTMFGPSSSAERKASGLQILSLAISTAPVALLPVVLRSPKLMKCIIGHRANTEAHLFEASKAPLDQLMLRVKHDPDVASVAFRALVAGGRPNFDHITKTKTIESIIRQASEQALESIVAYISEALKGIADHEDNAELYRRMLADLLLTAIRVHRLTDTLFAKRAADETDQSLCTWVRLLLDSLVCYGYEKTEQHMDESSPSEPSQFMFRARLMSCLGCLLDTSLEAAVLGHLHAVNALSTISQLQNGLSEEESDAVATATKLASESTADASSKATVRAIALLLALCTIQVYNKEADALGALRDLMSYCNSLQDKRESSTTLTELLLSFISRPSASLRKLAEQVFPVFAPQLTAEDLECLIDVLDQKESLRGQEALFDQHGDVEHDGEGSDSDDGNSGLDVEDASDIELVNGHEMAAMDSSDQVEDDDEALVPDAAVTAEDEEVAAFDKKLADALGTAGLEDSDDDGSDMDDEQMMALEPHLTTIFKERQKASSRKTEHKGAKENMVNFKNRVLGLLAIYVKSQYSKVIALDLILPLILLVRTTTNKATGEKAFAVLKQYFEACSKNKALPRLDDIEAGFTVLTAIHDEMKLGGSKLHANACSRASLFLSKVLVSMDKAHYARIAGTYAQLQSEWYADSKSNIASSVFTEWTSWSISMRKDDK